MTALCVRRIRILLLFDRLGTFACEVPWYAAGPRQMRLAVLVVALAMAEPEHAPRNGAARRRLRLKQVG